MTVELGKTAPRPIGFTLEGKPLAARPLPFRLFMEMAGAETSAATTEVMGKIILECVVHKDSGEQVFKDVDEVLDWDGAPLSQLFREVSKTASTVQAARKNSKASLP